MESRRGFLLLAAALPLAASESIASLEQRVFYAINFQRVSGDADPLTWSAELAATSREHSNRMVDARFFSHHDPKFGDLSDRIAAAGIAYLRCGENIFREKDFDDPVPLAVIYWMYSAGHRENILRQEFTHTGVGVAIAPDGTVAITQEFLNPMRVLR